MRNKDQILLWERPLNPNDNVYTPINVAKKIVSYLKPSGIILDPCKGDGAFYNNFPPGDNLHCELSEGTDFLEFSGKVDWVIGNPPYSVFFDFLQHSFEIADNVSFLVPTNKIFQRQVVMNAINKWGGIRSQIIFGNGTLLGFPFGFSVGNFHLKRGYRGHCKMIMGMKQISQMK